MTKSERIRLLYASGKWTVQEIAAKIGCSDSYVRVCARQRVGGISRADRNYRQRNPDAHEERLKRRQRAYYLRKKEQRAA